MCIIAHFSFCIVLNYLISKIFWKCANVDQSDLPSLITVLTLTMSMSSFVLCPDACSIGDLFLNNIKYSSSVRILKCYCKYLNNMTLWCLILSTCLERELAKRVDEHSLSMSPSWLQGAVIWTAMRYCTLPPWWIETSETKENQNETKRKQQQNKQQQQQQTHPLFKYFSQTFRHSN